MRDALGGARLRSLLDRLTGEQALSTGGTTLIGLETARQFLGDSVRGAITGTDPQSFEASIYGVDNYFEFNDLSRSLIVLSIISTNAPRMNPTHTPSRLPSIVPPIALISRERSERANPTTPPNTEQISAPPAAAQRVHSSLVDCLLNRIHAAPLPIHWRL